jgi:hypothetical protein
MKRVWLVGHDNVMVWAMIDLLYHMVSGLEIIIIPTESRFYEVLQDTKEAPDLLVTEVMLFWNMPYQKNPRPIPAHIHEQGFYRGGIRCVKNFVKKFPKTPVMICSILEKSDLERDLKLLPRNVQFYESMYLIIKPSAKFKRELQKLAPA